MSQDYNDQDYQNELELPDYINPNKNLLYEHANIDINTKLDNDVTFAKNANQELDLNKTHKNVLNLLQDQSEQSENVDFHTANVNLLGFIEKNDRQYDKINKLKEALGKSDSKDDLKSNNKNKNNHLKKNMVNKNKKNSIEENTEMKDKDSNNSKAKNGQKNTNIMNNIDTQNENIPNKIKDKKFSN